eukprot:1945062-Pleurochrysis_carterae.AAC.1
MSTRGAITCEPTCFCIREHSLVTHTHTHEGGLATGRARARACTQLYGLSLGTVRTSALRAALNEERSSGRASLTHACAHAFRARARAPFEPL